MSNIHYYMPLPRQAGYIITSIGGKKCTAVPRSVSTSKAVTTARPTETTQTSVRTTRQDNPSPVDSATFTTRPVAVPITSGTPSNEISRTRSLLTSVPTPEAISDASLIPTSRRPNQTSTSQGGTNDDNDNSTPLDLTSTRLSGATPTNTNINPGNSGDVTSVSAPNGSTNTGAIVGGILGVLGVLGIIGIILFFCRRRRKRKKESGLLLSPLPSVNQGKFYEIDSGSLGPSKKTTKWKREISSRAENAAYGLKMTMAEIGETLRDTVSRDRSETPSVDLDRGQSQFIQGNVASHSRNHSDLTEVSRRSSLRERLAKWRGRVGEVWQPQRQGVSMRGPLSNTSSMVESQMNNNERYRDSDQSGSVTTSNLGLALMNSRTSDLLRLENQPRDPFEDPYADEDPFHDSKMDIFKPLKPNERPFSDPFAAGDNPFSDPVITAPRSTISKQQTYIQHVRRSRGSSFSSAPSSNRSSRNSDLISFIDCPTSMTLTSPRAPSIIAPSHNSDRDTIYSSFSAERRGKGRSDPFDLDRADFYSRLSPKNRPKPSEQISSIAESPNNAASNLNRIKSMIQGNKARGHHRYNSSIRYSSGVDSLEGWGDAEDGAEGSTRGNANSRKSGKDLDGNHLSHGRADSEIGLAGKGVYGRHSINGSLVEIKVNFGGERR